MARPGGPAAAEAQSLAAARLRRRRHGRRIAPRRLADKTAVRSEERRRGGGDGRAGAGHPPLDGAAPRVAPEGRGGRVLRAGGRRGAPARRPAAAGGRRRALLDRCSRELELLAAAAARVELLITIPYHTRSAEALYERYAPERPTRIWGHANVRKRLRPDTPLEVVPAGAAGTRGRHRRRGGRGVHHRPPEAQRAPAVRARAARRRVRRRRRRRAGRPPLLEPEQRHRRGVVPRRVRSRRSRRWASGRSSTCWSPTGRR